VYDCGGEGINLRRGLNELRICQGIHVDIEKVEGVFELECSG